MTQIKDLIIRNLDRSKHLTSVIKRSISNSLEEAQVEHLLSGICAHPLIYSPKRDYQETIKVVRSMPERITFLLAGRKYRNYSRDRAKLPQSLSSDLFSIAFIQTVGLDFLTHELTRIRLESLINRMNKAIEDLASKIKLNLLKHEYFDVFKQDCSIILNLYLLEGNIDLSLAVDQISESFDSLILSYSEDELIKDELTRKFIHRVTLLKRNILGQENGRAFLLGRLSPKPFEIAKLLDQKSDIYKEVQKYFDSLQGTLSQINSKLDRYFEEQLVEHNYIDDTNFKQSDLSYEQRHILYDIALQCLTDEERIIFVNTNPIENLKR
ncbi:hypothetical protein [Phormidesmis priestleyi]|uniref:hypothetical protein n=1 Tax=Phormidesmis priestleyi TaxID=268141 RepID=UPI0011605662|nr:hypothetical protein [Phormidesmis priestleyi]